MKSGWPPNWQNVSQYPNPTSTKPPQWAWEFLRRNRDYQDLWTKLIEPSYDPTILERSWDNARKRSGRQTRPRIKPDPLTPFHVFHITSYPPAPWEGEAKVIFDAQRIQYETSRREKEAPVTGSKKPGQLIVWFELSWPEVVQFANARKIFREERVRLNISKNDKRRRTEGYQNYLRILDSQSGDPPIDLKDVALVIYPTKKNEYPNFNRVQAVRDDLDAAVKLRDHDYWRIALGAPK